MLDGVVVDNCLTDWVNQLFKVIDNKTSAF